MKYLRILLLSATLLLTNCTSLIQLRLDIDDAIPLSWHRTVEYDWHKQLDKT